MSERAHAVQAKTTVSLNAGQSGLLQRKCACGGGATRRPRPLRGEWHAEIRIVGGIS
jgi:hypothetical protein